MKKIEYKLVLMAYGKELLTVYNESMEALLVIAYERIMKASVDGSYCIQIKHDLIGRQDYWFVFASSSDVHGLIRQKDEWE